MLRDYVTVTIGVVTLLVASAAVYGILNVNDTIQARSEPAKIPDYTAELDSLKSQINTINNNLSGLDSLKSQVNSISSNLNDLSSIKGDMANIQKQLDDLKTQNTQQSTSASLPLEIILDKSTYIPGDTVKITAIGANSLQEVQVELVDSGGFVIVHKQTWADSNGAVIYDLDLSSSIVPGSYKVTLISGQKTSSQPVTISTSNQNVDNSAFTAQTDKTIYQKGELVQVTGKGQPNTTVTAVLSTPSGKTSTSSTTVQTDGSYFIFLSTSQSNETGTWYLNLTNLSQTKTIAIYMQSQ